MKINLNGKQRIFIAHGETDMRLSIDGLAALVQEYFQLDPFSSDLFLFVIVVAIKSKYFIGNTMAFGFTTVDSKMVVFNGPKGLEGETMDIDIRQLRWLLEGLTVEEGKVHPKIDAKKVV